MQAMEEDNGLVSLFSQKIFMLKGGIGTLGLYNKTFYG
jgi:hypothetical protein